MIVDTILVHGKKTNYEQMKWDKFSLRWELGVDHFIYHAKGKYITLPNRPKFTLIFFKFVDKE